MESSSQAIRSADYATPMIMVAGVCLNGLLAIINAWVFPASPLFLMVAQGALTAMTLVIVALRANRSLTPLLACTGLLIAFMVVAALNHGTSVRDINDILLIPVFLAVGLVAPRFPAKAFGYIFVGVFLSALLEITSQSIYLALFKPLEYLSATRVWIGDEVASKGLRDGLYLGADRAGGSFFSLADHRIGGIFLEPLSLGYFAIVSAMIFSVVYRQSFVKMSISMLACALLALVADSRAGIGLVVLFWLITLFPVQFPGWARFLAPIMVILIAALVYGFDLAHGTGDTMSRLAITVAEASKTPVVDLILGNVNTERFNDSAILRIGYSATIFGLVIALYIYSGALIGRFPRLSSIPVLAGIYITFTALFGGAFLSIKTAAIFGVFVGTAANGRVGVLSFRKPSARAQRVPKLRAPSSIDVLPGRPT